MIVDLKTVPIAIEQLAFKNKLGAMDLLLLLCAAFSFKATETVSVSVWNIPITYVCEKNTHHLNVLVLLAHGNPKGYWKRWTSLL